MQATQGERGPNTIDVVGLMEASSSDLQATKHSTCHAKGKPNASSAIAAQKPEEAHCEAQRQPSARPRQQASLEMRGVPRLPQQRHARRTKPRACHTEATGTRSDQAATAASPDASDAMV
jgi:hypothetical protein